MADSSPKLGFSAQTLSFASGAVSDIFAGFGAAQSAKLSAAGLNLQAGGLRIKAQGDYAEAQSYDLASTLAARGITRLRARRFSRRNSIGKSISRSAGSAQTSPGRD